jgi:hypothetical protein
MVGTDLMFILVVGGALCGWALLSVMGAERERLRAQAEAKRPTATPTTAPTPEKPAPAKPAPPRGAPKPARAEKNVR